MAIAKIEARTTRIDCPNCAKTAEEEILHLPGIASARIDLLNAKVLYTFDPELVDPQNLRKRIEGLGHFKFVDDPADRKAKLPFSRTLAWLLLTALVLYAGGAIFTFGLGQTLIGQIIFSVATLVGGGDILRRAYLAAKHRRLDINTLMAIAIAGAIAIGDLHEAVVVVLLFSMANLIESYSLWRLSRSLTRLTDFTSSLALRKTAEGVQRVDPESLQPGDVVIVKEGMRIPVDGRVLSGSSFVDISSLTGEAQPYSVNVGTEVWAGSLNIDGYLEVETASAVDDSRIGKILKLVGEAGARKARVEKFVDRFAKIYTPIVVVAAVLVALVPPLIFGGLFGEWFYKALVFLVISCPCALVLSTPIAVTTALAAASRMKAIFRGGDTLEQMANIKTIAFDKTGTLTTGVLALERIESIHELSSDDILQIAGSLEAVSQHPVARAISAAARHKQLSLLPVSDARSIPGVGVVGVIDGVSYEIKVGILDNPSDSANGRRLHLVRNGVAEAALYLRDEIRADAKTVIAGLRSEGITSIGILSGDSRTETARVAESLGLDFSEGELLPDRKYEQIDRLGPSVAMVGDGINDIVALSAADVSISLARFGNEIPAQHADILLLGENLAGLPGLFRLGKRTLTTIKINIVFAFAVKLLFLGLALAGYADLWMAVVADMGASLAVIFNSLRLLRS